jgi:hypothetical protein
VDGIDWSTELKKISREYDGLPPEPSPAKQTAKQPAKPPVLSEPKIAKPRPQPATSTIREFSLELPSIDIPPKVAVWARFALVACLAFAPVMWPYGRSCGGGLYMYMAACAMIVIGGLWVTLWTWHTGMALAHTLTLLLVLVGLVSFTAEILPRTGYAKPTLSHPAHWRCVSSSSR